MVLSDRRTHVIPKGPDHPTVFAQGMPDTTPGGIFYGAPGEVSDVGETSASCWRALKPGEAYTEVEVDSADVDVTDTEIKDVAAAVLGLDVSRSISSTIAASAVVSGTPSGTIWGRQRREFLDDSELQFLAREEWGGARLGMVFRMGSLGLGYYEDKPLTERLSGESSSL